MNRVRSIATPPVSRHPTGVRFAPSPTGTFHVGNLRTAWISWLWSRHLGEPWVLRFEDIDQPRVRAGALESQLADMAALGLEGDFVLRQGDFHARHFELLSQALMTGQVYPCFCSRKEIQTALAGAASAPHGPVPTYSGSCRGRDARSGWPKVMPAWLGWRFRMDDPSGTEDFIVARTVPVPDSDPLELDPNSFVPSYPWACAIDDADGNYRLLVRAWDLASSLPQQRAIQKWLASREGREPSYPQVFHTSLVTSEDGHRLEKRTVGVTLRELHAAGFDSMEILRRFERSFDRTHLNFVEGNSSGLGEARHEVRLSEIGF